METTPHTKLCSIGFPNDAVELGHCVGFVGVQRGVSGRTRSVPLSPLI